MGIGSYQARDNDEEKAKVYLEVTSTRYFLSIGKVPEFYVHSRIL